MIVFLSAYTKVPSFNQRLNTFMDYIRCDTHHGRAGGECQQPGEQSLQLLYDSWRRLHKHRLQAGQCGELDALIGTQQRLQQQRQELEGCKNLSNVWLHASQLFVTECFSVHRNEHGVVWCRLTAGSSVTWTCLGSLFTMFDRAFR